MSEGNFISWDDMLHKKYTKEQMLSFAEHCMTQLLTEYPNGEDDMGEMSMENVIRISKVLKKYKTNE